MEQKKPPMRHCTGCGAELPKKELIRIVHTPDDEYHVDPGGKAAGRGAYVCRNSACLEKAFRTESLSRSFRTKVPKEALDVLLTEVKDLA